MKKEKKDTAAPAEIANALRESVWWDHQTRVLQPDDEGDILDLARWGRGQGLAYGAREALGLEPWKPLTLKQIAAFVAKTISPHPEVFREKAEALRELEALQLCREAKRLDGCGKPWGRLVRLFWMDRKGREVMRTRGLHSCKHRWCPRCGKARQTKRAGQMERVVELAREWDFNESNIRFVTLTVPNGKTVQALREQAHAAWARLQKTRWWPGRVFGWFRGSEVVVGKDGNWNMHMHIVVILWSKQISYQNIWDAWETACGARYQVDIDSLRDIRTKARERGTSRAIHYITKYIAKSEDLSKLNNGPGGLTHLFSGTSGMRNFAMGGGCSVLRRMLDVLMPTWALQAERVMEDAELRDGKAPFRAEEVDPETGEVTEVEIPKPYLDEFERKRWRALAVPLWIESSGTVGRRAGPRGQFRRVGDLPMAGKALPLANHRKGKPQTGIRSLVAGGRWKLQQWSEVSKKTGKKLNFSVVLPRGRYAWSPIAAQVWAAMGLDQGGWARARREAFRRHAEAALDPLAHRDNMHSIRAALDDRMRMSDGDTFTATTRRSLKAAELWASYTSALRAYPEAHWFDEIRAIRTRALYMERPNLLTVEGPALRRLRLDLESTY